MSSPSAIRSTASCTVRRGTYDTHIPILFYGAPFIRQGQWNDAVAQQDIAPTLARLIGATPAPTFTGRVLSNALAAWPGAAARGCCVRAGCDARRLFRQVRRRDADADADAA